MNALGGTTAAPARLDISVPWELPDAAKGVIGEAIAGEAWLQRLGLEGLLTGISNADMRVFKSSVERLAGLLRYAHHEGALKGTYDEREIWRVRVWLVAGGAFFGGVVLVGLIGLFP
jgi:hypothetical protein